MGGAPHPSMQSSEEPAQGQGFVYSGQIEKGQMHGKGTLVYPNGEKYEGEWQWGKRHGVGRMTFPDGSRYTGDWVDDRVHGQVSSARGPRAPATRPAPPRLSSRQIPAPEILPQPASPPRGLAGCWTARCEAGAQLLTRARPPTAGRAHLREREPVQGRLGGRDDHGGGRALVRGRRALRGRAARRPHAGPRHLHLRIPEHQILASLELEWIDESLNFKPNSIEPVVSYIYGESKS